MHTAPQLSGDRMAWGQEWTRCTPIHMISSGLSTGTEADSAHSSQDHQGLPPLHFFCFGVTPGSTLWAHSYQCYVQGQHPPC